MYLAATAQMYLATNSSSYMQLFLFSYRTTRKPSSMAAFLPLTFLFGYQADLAYGTKLNRVKVEAENILLYEADLIEMPAGLPSLESIDAANKKMASKKE